MPATKPLPLLPDDAVRRLVALGHRTRLALFRLLVEAGAQGMPAGALAARLDLAPSSLTFHLQQLQHAGLIAQRRLGRQLFYAVDIGAMNGLLAYLTENCCGRDAAACAPFCDLAQPAAKPARAARRAG